MHQGRSTEVSEIVTFLAKTLDVKKLDKQEGFLGRLDHMVSLTLAVEALKGLPIETDWLVNQQKGVSELLRAVQKAQTMPEGKWASQELRTVMQAATSRLKEIQDHCIGEAKAQLQKEVETVSVFAGGAGEGKQWDHELAEDSDWETCNQRAATSLYLQRWDEHKVSAKKLQEVRAGENQPANP